MPAATPVNLKDLVCTVVLSQTGACAPYLANVMPAWADIDLSKRFDMNGGLTDDTRHGAHKRAYHGVFASGHAIALAHACSTDR